MRERGRAGAALLHVAAAAAAAPLVMAPMRADVEVRIWVLLPAAVVVAPVEAAEEALLLAVEDGAVELEPPLLAVATSSRVNTASTSAAR